MKRILLIVIALLALTQTKTYAQVYLGGSLNMSKYAKDEGTFSFDFSPEVGYSWKNWSFGAVLTVNLSNYNLDSGGIDRQRNLGFSPYVEYYFLRHGIVSLYVEGGCEFRFSVAGSPNENNNRINPYFAPGLDISLGDHWSLLCHLGRLEWDSRDNRFSFNLFTSNLGLGLFYTF